MAVMASYPIGINHAPVNKDTYFSLQTNVVDYCQSEERLPNNEVIIMVTLFRFHYFLFNTHGDFSSTFDILTSPVVSPHSIPNVNAKYSLNHR